MMRIQYEHQILRERSRLLRVAVGDMGDEFDKISKRNNAVVSRRGRCLEEDFSLGFILIVLIVEVVFIGAISRSAST